MPHPRYRVTFPDGTTVFCATAGEARCLAIAEGGRCDDLRAVAARACVAYERAAGLKLQVQFFDAGSEMGKGP